MYYTQDMSWKELYEISLSNKYFLADIDQCSCLRDQSFVIFDDPDEMFEWFVYQHDGYENDEGQIAKVVGYEQEGESEVSWWDANHNKQINHMSFYIPKIEWVDKDKA